MTATITNATIKLEPINDHTFMTVDELDRYDETQRAIAGAIAWGSLHADATKRINALRKRPNIETDARRKRRKRRKRRNEIEALRYIPNNASADWLRCRLERAIELLIDLDEPQPS